MGNKRERVGDSGEERGESGEEREREWGMGEKGRVGGERERVGDSGIPLVAGVSGVCTVTGSSMGQISLSSIDSTLNVAASSADTIGSYPIVCMRVCMWVDGVCVCVCVRVCVYACVCVCGGVL